jgi:hypothetical protein
MYSVHGGVPRAGVLAQRAIAHGDLHDTSHDEQNDQHTGYRGDRGQRAAMRLAGVHPPSLPCRSWRYVHLALGDRMRAA